MNEGQIITVLASFIGTLIGITYFVIRWATKRMDKKDERFAEVTKEDRNEFLSITKSYREDMMTQAQQSHLSTSQFTEAAHTFANVVEKQMGDWCKEIEADRLDRVSFQKHVQEEHAKTREDHQHQADNQAQIALILVGLHEAVMKLCAAWDVKSNGKDKNALASELEKK